MKQTSAEGHDLYTRVQDFPGAIRNHDRKVEALRYCEANGVTQAECSDARLLGLFRFSVAELPICFKDIVLCERFNFEPQLNQIGKYLI